MCALMYHVIKANGHGETIAFARKYIGLQKQNKKVMKKNDTYMIRFIVYLTLSPKHTTAACEHLLSNKNTAYSRTKQIVFVIHCLHEVRFVSGPEECGYIPEYSFGIFASRRHQHFFSVVE